MEYRKLTGEGCTSCVTKVFIVFGLVISVILWFVLFFGLYTLNNELALLRSEQEKIICMIRVSEYNFFFNKFRLISKNNLLYPRYVMNFVHCLRNFITMPRT